MCLQLQISDMLHLKQEEFLPLLSVYSPLGSFTDTAKSSAHV